MSWFSSKKSLLLWNHINSIEELNLAISNSNEQSILLFKHSTSCSISSMAKSRLEDKWSEELEITPYYIDLLAFRNVSNEIAERFNVTHQSPQVLIVSNEKCVGNCSHNEINLDSIIKLM
jgi:bacillithiol system protein YtxJ